MSDSLFLRSISSEKLVVGAVSAASVLVATGGSTHVRIIADCAINVATGVDPTATVDDMYVPAFVELLTILAEGEQVAVVGATGNVWITSVSVG
ncbi:MAG: hypothetical protein ABI067_15775 [Leifsonia sp.]